MNILNSQVQSKVFKLLSLAAVAAALLVGASRASADVLTFDDLPGSEDVIPDGYGGFNWNNFWYVDGTNIPNSGYDPGIVSPNNVAFNSGGTPASLVVTSSTEFSFDGAYLTAAWYDGLSVEVQGYNGANLLYDTTVSPSATASTFFTFNYANVDELDFSSFGGTPHPGYNGSGTQFAMDNFTFNESVAPVPEPATIWGLCGICAMGIGIVCYRRTRALAT